VADKRDDNQGDNQDAAGERDAAGEQGTVRLLARAIRTLIGVAPGVFVLTVVAAFFQGIGPNFVTLAGARVIGLAPRLADSADARRGALLALSVVGAALLLERVAGAMIPVLQAYTGHRFVAALDRLRISACVRLPGLEHFESPALADRLQAAEWSKTGPATLVVRLVALVRRGAMLAGSLLILVRLGWWVPLLICGSAVAIGVNDWRHAGTRAGLRREESSRLRYSDYHRELAVDPLQAREVRLFGLGEWLADRQRRYWQEGTAAVFADLRRQLRENSVINLARGATLVLPVLVAVFRLRDGSIGAETFTAALLALRTASNGMYVLEGIAGGLRETIVFLPDVLAVEQLPERDPRLTTAGRLAAPATLADGIRFTGVEFTYPGATRPVLAGVDLHLAAGESLALVGENGAGKSTLVKLLCRFYDPSAGRITIDGIDLRELDLELLRARMAVVFQDFTRLPVSAWDNIAVASGQSEVDDQVVRAAAADAGMSPVAADLPGGWDTVLSREFGGVDLSGGQWQRLALARLLVAKRAHDAPVLLLDEPTAALDVGVEAELYDRFAELSAGATTMLVSHRFSTVRMAARVAVLAGGRITEQGSHEALVRSGGQYAELYGLQARRFQESGGVR
jgi:ATP-binding cassette, subfamily B, bacterial